MQVVSSRLHIGQLDTCLRDGERSFDLCIEKLQLDAGDIVALTGPSGSGKTLALELLCLLRAPTGTGSYQLAKGGDFTDLAALWDAGVRNPVLARTRGRVFGIVPQTGGLVPFLTVRENITLPQKVNDCDDADWICTLVERLGLSSVEDMTPADLSIGQRQRTAIARALAHKPNFVIADEPTSALDPDSADDVLRLFLVAANELGCGVLLSSHDQSRIDRFGLDRWHVSVRTKGSAATATVKVAGVC